MLGGNSPSGLIQPGRVEVISFFFLGCTPSNQELSVLDALQEKYGKKKLLVTGVTSYKINSNITPSHVEASLQEARLEKARHIGVVITSDEALATYGVRGFLVVAILDKMGRLRY